MRSGGRQFKSQLVPHIQQLKELVQYTVLRTTCVSCSLLSLILLNCATLHLNCVSAESLRGNSCPMGVKSKQNRIELRNCKYSTIVYDYKIPSVI